MKKLLLILLCLPFIGFGQLEKEERFNNIIGNSIGGILPGKVIAKGDIAPEELIGYENSGGCVVQEEYGVSVIFKGDKNIVLFTKFIDRNGINEKKILDYIITYSDKDESILLCDCGTNPGEKDDRIIAKAIFADWEFVKLSKAWKINIDRLKIENIGISNVSYEHEGL